MFVRHAKSSWSQDLADHDRPLNARGRQAAKTIGSILKAKGLIPNIIWSSDSARTRETIALMFAVSEIQQTEFISSLYHGSANQVLTVCAQRGEPTCGPLMLVGHNPGYEMLLEYFTNVSRSYPTGACLVLKRVDKKADWLSPEAWRLEDFIRPKDVMR